MARESAPSLNESMKIIATNLMQTMKLTDILYGTVSKVSPLEIAVDQKLILTEPFLVLTNMVKDHYVDVTVSMQTENDKFLIKDHTHPYEDTQPNGQPVIKATQTTLDLDVTHKHEIKHTIKMLKHYGLKVGEKVILVRMQGGRKYLVLDRIETPICNGEWL